MTSLWLDRNMRSPGYPRESIQTDPISPGRRYDIVVAGAGLTGLTTALLFARAGRSVAVVEARQVGAVTSGNTTAKVSLLQGTHLSELLRHTSLRNAKAYVEANREGMEWLLRYCNDHGIPAQRRDAYSYAGTEDGVVAVRRELRAARRLGLNATEDAADELPFKTYGALRLANQAQINPMDVLAALAADVRRHGGVIHEGVRVQGVRAGTPVFVETNRGVFLAEKLVLATGTPILDRGLYFAKMTAHRSYGLAFRVPGELPQGMYLSVDAPTRSLRTALVDGEERLVVGGNGHIVGRSRSPRALVADLDSWTRENFTGAERSHAWSAQDYRPAGRIPFVGWLPRGHGRIFIATGYDKWGMSNAVAASLTLAADILGGHLPWANTLHRRVSTPADVGSFLGANAAVGVELARGYWNAWWSKPSTPPEGSGMVAHDGTRPIGVCTVNGVTSRVSAVCPHLGGVLSWNDAEFSWDCPLHGSRFTANGTRLEGPAVDDLGRR